MTHSYHSIGQVDSGKKYFSDGTPVPGQQFEYGFDDIGNRTSTKAGGDSLGSGASHATNSVTINGSAADYRRGEYFQELVAG